MRLGVGVGPFYASSSTRGSGCGPFIGLAVLFAIVFAPISWLHTKLVGAGLNSDFAWWLACGVPVLLIVGIIAAVRRSKRRPVSPLPLRSDPYAKLISDLTALLAEAERDGDEEGAALVRAELARRRAGS